MTAERTLSDLGERRIVAETLALRYHSNSAFGDDCAPVPFGRSPGELVATTDPCPAPLVASLGWDDLYYEGWLLATINLSDLAAAGAEPLGLMVSYVLPGQLTLTRFERLLSGVDDCCAAHSTQVLGGNIGDGPAVHLTATAIGWCEPGKRLGRQGARPGDALVLLGAPGYLWATALLRLGHASVPDPGAVFDRALHPRAQIPAAVALARRELVRAAVDVSDGLFAAVASLCDRNGLGASVSPDIRLDPPVGEICHQAAVRPFDLAQLWGDWTLLVAVDATDLDQVLEVTAGAGSSAQPIGVMTGDPGIVVDGPDGPEPWQGAYNERFTPTSWHAGEVGNYVARLRRGGPG